MQHVHRLPGAAREHPLPAGEGREAALRPHAERIGARLPAHSSPASSSTTSSPTAPSIVPEALRPYVGSRPARRSAMRRGAPERDRRRSARACCWRRTSCTRSAWCATCAPRRSARAAMYARVFRAQNDTSAGARTPRAAARSVQGHRRAGCADGRHRPARSADPYPGEPAGATALRTMQTRSAAFVRELDEQNRAGRRLGRRADSLRQQPLVKWLRIIPLLQARDGVHPAVGGPVHRCARAAAPSASGCGPAWRASRRTSSARRSPASRVDRAARGSRSRRGHAARRSTYMHADLERLERVAHRFERIGREPRREPVDVGELVDRIAATSRRACRRSRTP